MMIKEQLVEYIIKPILEKLGMYSTHAIDLLLITCINESNTGTFIKQYPSGPALGIYQMEPDTYYDIWDNYLKYKPKLRSLVLDTIECQNPPDANNLLWDMRLATVMARIQYYRWPEALPDNLNDLIDYYLKYWAPNPKYTNSKTVIEKVFRHL